MSLPSPAPSLPSSPLAGKQKGIHLLPRGCVNIYLRVPWGEENTLGASTWAHLMEGREINLSEGRVFDLSLGMYTSQEFHVSGITESYEINKKNIHLI